VGIRVGSAARITNFSTASGVREWAISRVVMWRLLGGMSQRSGWRDQPSLRARECVKFTGSYIQQSLLYRADQSF